MLYVMFHAIVMSGPMAEHNDGRLNTIGLGHRPYYTGYPRRRQITTFSASVLKLYGTIRLGKSSGTLYGTL